MIEDSFIFYPEAGFLYTPGDLGMPYEDIYFPTSDNFKLHGWLVHGTKNITLLWFHGNAGNISHRVENLLLLQRHLDINIFLFDYRGYGRSQGKPSEKGTYLDSEAAYSYLLSRGDVQRDKIIAFGQSLGSAVATYLASREHFLGVILESAFTNVKDMARRVVPLIPGFVLRVKFDSLSRIRSIKAPILFIHGDADDIVPIELGRRLYREASEPKKFYAIPGAGHNDTYVVGGERYFETLKYFVEGLSYPKQAALLGEER